MRLLNQDGVFLCRAAAVLRRDGRFLLHRAKGDDFWAFPGGKLKMGETLAAAVERELNEELGWAITTRRLLWVVENFFEYPGGMDTAETSAFHHEIGFYFLVDAPDEVSRPGSHFVETESDGQLEFRWFHLADMDAIDLRPRALKDLLGDLSGPTRVLVNRDV